MAKQTYTDKLLANVDARFSALAEHYRNATLPPQFVKSEGGAPLFRSVRPVMQKIEGDAPEQTTTQIISTISVDRGKDSMVPDGAELKNFWENPVVLPFHNASVPNVGHCVGLQKTSTSIITRTWWNLRTQISKDLYVLYKNREMFAYSIGWRPIEYEMIETDEEVKQEYDDGTTVTYPETYCLHKKWELLEYSPVAVPMNAEAVSLEPMATEKFFHRVIQKGLIAPDSELMKLFSVNTKIKTLSSKTMDTKKLSASDAEEIKGHVKAMCKGLVATKDAMTVHAKGLALHKDAMDLHLKAMDKGAVDEDAQDAHKSAFEAYQDAAYEHEKSFGKAKDAFEKCSKSVKGLHESLKGYAATGDDINDDVDAATAPFNQEETEGGGSSNDVANVLAGVGKAVADGITKGLKDAGIVAPVPVAVAVAPVTDPEPVAEAFDVQAILQKTLGDNYVAPVETQAK